MENDDPVRREEKFLAIVNFKSMRAGSGKNAIALAKLLEQAQASLSFCRLAIAVQLHDLYLVAQETSLPIFAQHVDPIVYGSYSGSICPAAVKEAGAYGTLLNHPEKKITNDIVERTLIVTREAGLQVVLCASSVEEGKKLSRYRPDYICIENEILIGKSTSITQTCPEVIDAAIAHIDNRLLFGAGIRSVEDVRFIAGRGGAGIVVSSLILNASDPALVIQKLLIYER